MPKIVKLEVPTTEHLDQIQEILTARFLPQIDTMVNVSRIGHTFFVRDQKISYQAYKEVISGTQYLDAVYIFTAPYTDVQGHVVENYLEHVLVGSSNHELSPAFKDLIRSVTNVR